MSALKSRIAKAFNAKLAREPIVEDIGLSVVLEEKTDLMSVMREEFNESSGIMRYRDPAVCELMDEWGVILFLNGYLSKNPNTHLSARGIEGLRHQHVFHRDQQDVTFIYKPHGMKRSVPTYYTYAENVRLALSLMDTSGLPAWIVENFDDMIKPSFTFSVRTACSEKIANDQLRESYKDFNEIIYNLIPDGRKRLHSWDSDSSMVVAHSNRPHFIVHGRPKGSAGRSELIGMDISR